MDQAQQAVFAVTSITEVRTIGDHEDTTSFLVPSYGFRNESQALEFLNSPVKGVGSRMCVVNVYAPRDSDGQVTTYAKNPGVWLDELGTSLLTHEPRNKNGGLPQEWKVLRAVNTPKPDSAYNVGVMVEGKRSYHRSAFYKGNTPSWLVSLNSGWRDCFAVWNRIDGSPLSPIYDDGESRIFVARSGRGAIYAATTVYNKSGLPIGNEMRLLLIEFTILDKDPNKDDVMRLTFVSQERRFADACTDISEIPKPDLSYRKDLDRDWCMLAETAWMGFKDECSPSDPMTETRRIFLVNQFALKQTDDLLPHRVRFIDKIKNDGIEWDAAIAMCDEPWKFTEVITEFSGYSMFWQTPGIYMGARYVRVENMLKMLKCSKERLEQLREWIRMFVTPCDSMWDYVGD